MNSFQQACPTCGATLELPGQESGKAAVCPSCQTEFVAAVPVTEPPVSKPPTATPMPGYRSVSIESVVAHTQSVLFHRRRPLFVPFLVPALLVVVAGVIPVAFLSGLATTNPARAWIGMGILMPWFLMLATYAVWFALERSSVVCDDAGESAESQAGAGKIRFLPPLDRLVSLSIAVLMLAVWITGCTAVSIAVAQFSGKIAAWETRVLVVGISVVVSSVFGLAVAMRFWPLFPLLAGGSRLLPAMRASVAMTRVNSLTSFLLVIAAGILLGGGFSLFGLGLPITVPVCALLWTVAQRLIDGTPLPLLQSSEAD
ncbi:hypothetical protein NHH03_09155 [Stieleria sp. TO1_6]|uniref:hypothetical protein n=1 Tax=Stieleria tagensis TaxID=2956795 RepID=UPI00209B40A9|nr:hypothetical protein [Stieleria tagensis]MCO8121902.1 hypothetical protein [Stieleria tagensis]